MGVKKLVQSQGKGKTVPTNEDYKRVGNGSKKK